MYPIYILDIMYTQDLIYISFAVVGMGEIISTQQTRQGKVLMQVEVDHDEALMLRGHMRNVRLFSEEASGSEANISERGKNGATKYFRIPRHLRRNLPCRAPVNCQKLETDNRVLFVYSVQKDAFS